MGSSAEELVLRITGDSEGAKDAIKGLEERVHEATTSFGKAALEGMGPMGAAAGVAAVAATALGTAMMELGQHATEVAAELQKVSLTTGIAVPALTDLKFAIESTVGSLDQLNNVMFMFEQRMVNSSAKVDAGLKMIGLSLESIDAMSHDQQLLAISDAMRASGEDTNKAAVAMDIFGRSGRTVLPQLLQPLSDLAAKSKELGSITAEAAEKAHEFEIAQKTMAAEGGRAWTELGLAVAPTTNAISLGWDRMKLAVANVALTGMDLVHWIAETGDKLEALSPNVETSHAALERLGGDLPKVSDSLKGLADGSGLAAAQMHKFWTEFGGGEKAPSLDNALENEKEAIRDLDSETQKHIETMAKHKAAVDALVAGLEGESKKSGDTVEAVKQVIASHTEDADVIQRVVDQIDKLYDHSVKISDEMLIWADANRVVKGSLDNLGMFLSQVGVLVPENTAHLEAMAAIMDEAHNNVDNLAASGLWLDSVEKMNGERTIPGWIIGMDLVEERTGAMTQAIKNATKETASFSEELTGSLETALQKMPSTLAHAFEGGGGLKGAAQALGSKFGADFGKSILGEEGSGGLADTLTSHLGETMGGIASAAIPAVGALIGPLIGKLFSIGGPSAEELSGRKVESTFESQFGSFQKMMDAVGAAYAATGKTAQQAQSDVKALMDAEKQGGAATQAMADQINSAFTDQKQDAADLTAAIQKYGFTIDELGPTMQKQDLDAQAKQLITDWTALEKSGINVVTVDQKMASSTWDYLQMAKRTGVEVPEAMKPVIQSMLDQGVFTDANGQKITDMGQLGVTFAQTMTEGFDKVVAKLNELLVQIGKVPDALGNIKPVPAPWSDWGAPPSLGDGGGAIPIPMASGGIGRVTRPTLFLAGESGAEDYAFSGGGKSFKGGGMSGGVVVNVTVEGNVATERDLADAIGQHLANDFMLRGGALPLGVSR